MGQIKVLHIVTDSISTVLMRGQLAYLRARCFDPAVASNPGPELDQRADKEGCSAFGIAMKREIAPVADLESLFALWRMLRRFKPLICNSSTPKAGLLGGLAGWLARVPCRVYTLRGLRLETAKGPKKLILALAEKVACLCAHRVICVSASLRDRAIALGIVSRAKTVLLGSGSSNGVDVKRFAPSPEKAARAVELRQHLRIRPNQPVIGFVGRLTRDKGVPELVAAFQLIRRQWPEAVLLLVGQYEAGDPVSVSTKAAIESDIGIRHVESTFELEHYYSAMDVFVLPTYREGMPNTVLEAQATELPVITTRATGAIDAIEDGVTGLLTPVGNAGALAEAVISLLSNRDRARQMGRLGRERVVGQFRNELAWEELVSLYMNMLQETSVPGRYSMDSNSLGVHCKRILDLIGALCALAIFFPVLLLITLAIWGTMGRPILFRQVRPGKDGNPFTLFKFRTMTETGFEDIDIDPSTDATRLTPIGLLLRRFSLDELPQLWNVLKGEMSLVGPRPLLMEYLDFYTEEQAKRHRMKPGITGLAQTKGRNGIKWEEKLYWDVWYVDHWSVWFDIRIIVVTIIKIMQGDGVSQEGHATMEKFGASSR